MRVLVTGGGGFLGTYICERLLKAGHEVASFSRHKYEHLSQLGVTNLQGDITDKNAVRQALENIDAIIHTAAMAGVWGSRDKFYNINTVGTQNIVDAAIEKSIKYFVYTSSPSVAFGKEDIMGADESIGYPGRYLNHYSETKAMAEKYVLGKSRDSFRCIAIRPHLIWGKGDPHLIPRIVQKSREEKLKMVGEGDNLVDVTYVENAAFAHELALNSLVESDKHSGKAYFIGQESPVNLWEFINQILLRSGRPAVEDKISFKKAYAVGLVMEKLFGFAGITKPEPPMTRFVATQLAKHHYFSHKNAEQDLGYRPLISTPEALEKTFIHRTQLPENIKELLT